MFAYISHSAFETQNLAEKIGRVIPSGTVLALTGELAAGKTTFCQGLAKGMGIADAVTSPTFVLLQAYQGIVPFCHIDAYRITEDEVDETGLEECFDGHAVVAVEWPEAVRELMPEDTVEIRFSYDYGKKQCGQTDADQSARRIVFEYQPEKSAWLEEVLKCSSSV